MAKTSVIARQRKRERLVEKYAQKRTELKKVIQNPNTSMAERLQAQQAFQKLPRDSASVRLRNRCRLTGRPRGVYRMFGLSRSILRLHAMRGELPGVMKSSW